ncbi:unknown [Mycoplasma sp. CAG:776]|nr:unknown [Mycoplasma sp. CAG:776]
MKKLFLLGFVLIFLSGCTSIENSSIGGILSDSINSRVDTTNVNRNGYRYYLPKGLFIKSSKEFNEIISDQKYLYYLYVDIVSYDSEVGFSYMVNQDAYYSANLVNQNKNGFIEINNYENDQYLIEIMYNYAKIEVVAYERDIKKVVAYAMSILTSITYNNSVIENYLGDDIFESSEEKYDIFEIVGSDNYLQFTEDIEETDEIRDPDYVN